ncbi:D-alanyl-D-alanine carboxypeptidase DacB precursor [Maioricimonas rarisocia]|uniref:D-alanyl-D-alanine carboxypeptidase DacB n=1 Tax=Maioricimonas rarisocia TaxID=2528026 RepID=A0A517Z306_9PLAN|nr:serine hydrolase [Maioricimonas rarisocia]QDU36838.1 D-alanyl-D-alanine carboxypeptidase DacB precursor [Maioricimonas rarisocia]
MLRMLSCLFIVAVVSPSAITPLQAGSEDLDAPPVVTAAAWAIADGETGEILWEHDAGKGRKIASITKTMAALVVLSLVDEDPSVLDEVITFSEAADRTGGSTSDVNAGEQVTVREGLYGLMLPSGNDMGNALAEHFHPRLDSPDQRLLDNGLDNPVHAKRINFIAEMNRLAQRFGMEQTIFRIAYGDGGEADQPTSSAADLILLARQAIAHPRLREIIRTREYTGTITLPDGSTREQVWKNTNQLLGLDLGYDGIKTGTTRTAGRCLLSTGVREGTRLIVVVLGADSGSSRYTDSRNLYRWAWRQLEHSGE